MGRRHLHAYRALRAVGAEGFELAAVCDQRLGAAEEAAGLAEEILGARPAVYSDNEELISSGVVQALDLVADPSAHHTIAVPALDAGLHVICEKPLGITVRAAGPSSMRPRGRARCWRPPRTTAGTRRTGWRAPSSRPECSATCT